MKIGEYSVSATLLNHSRGSKTTSFIFLKNNTSTSTTYSRKYSYNHYYIHQQKGEQMRKQKYRYTNIHLCIHTNLNRITIAPSLHYSIHSPVNFMHFIIIMHFKITYMNNATHPSYSFLSRG